MAQQPQHGDGNLNLLYKIADNTYDISQNGGSPGGLGTMSTQDADNVSITGGDLSGVTINAESLEVGNAVTADLYVGPDGNVGIGTETTTEKLTVNGNIDISNGQIKNLGVPLDDTDAATKLYVDTAATGAAGGDLSGNYPDPNVVKLQGNDVSNAAPANGQVLQWNGTAWVPGTIPTGGSGGGGLVYFLNYQNTTGISPTTGLPTSPVAVSQLGRNYDLGSASITSDPLTTSYTLVCGFVTIVGEPNVTEIPAGLWDFNIWANVSSASGNETQFQIRIFKYNSTTGVYTSLASSDDIYIYDPARIAQYIGNVTMPQTTILATDRIYIELWAQKNVSGARTVSFYFDSLYPSHFHTTLPSVSGSGVVKVVNGVFQSPASTIVNADVDASAAISQSKILNLTSDLLGKARTSDVQIFATVGSSNWIKPAGAKSVNIQLFGAGAGGSSGSRGTAGSVRIAGGGGGGGGYFSTTIEASLLSSSESVTIGAGGPGGNARTTDQLGQAGQTGGDTIFGLFRATGGRGPSSYETAGLAGSLMGGGGAPASLAGSNGSSAAPSALSTFSSTYSRGGGSGGGLNASNIPTNGGNGGFATTINQAGGAFGIAGGVVNGGDGYSVTAGFFVAGSGGGGGASATTGNAGSGGNGGFPAGAGGGGGAAEAGNSGAGGTGANGLAIITTYF